MPLLSRLLLLFCCFASHLALRLPHVSYAHLLQLGIACIRHAHVPCIRHARIPSAMHDASHEPHALPPSPTSRTHLSHARTSHAKVHQQRGLCGLDPNAASSTIVSSLGNLGPAPSRNSDHNLGDSLPLPPAPHRRLSITLSRLNARRSPYTRCFRGETAQLLTCRYGRPKYPLAH